MASNVFGDVLKNLRLKFPEIIRYGMLRSGGKFYSQTRKILTLMVLVVFSGIDMTKVVGYIGTLEWSSLFTKGARLSEENWISQQDDPAIHTTRRSKDFSQANDIRILDLSTCSPDLNPENLWGWRVKWRLYK